MVGLVGLQAGARVAVLVRAGDGGAPAALRAPLRPARAGPAGGRCSPRRRPRRDEAQRELLRIAARALGVAAERDLRDYFRLAGRRREGADRRAGRGRRPASRSRSRAGARTRGYLAAGARIPRRVEATALIGPFDSLIWERSRVERIFGFDFRLEIYVPAPKRRHGYYVLPFLLGDRLVARVDLKADRAAGVLRVPAVHLEPGAPPETADALDAELSTLASWLGLERDATS